MPRVAIIGGGITGLSAAWFLRGHAGVTLFEADDRLGGKIRTDDFAGRRVEAGPDAFLARVPHGVELARLVGLGDRLTAPATGAAYVWARKKLRRLPAGTVLGAPTDIDALRDSGLVSKVGALRARLDFVLPRTNVEPDIAVGRLINERYGREVNRHLIDPLLGGIHTGPADRLSTAAVAPQFFTAAKANRSFIRGLRETSATPSGEPVFFTIRDGLSALVDSLASGVPDIRRGTAVTALERDGGGWRVDGQPFDAVIVTTPSYAAAELLAPVAPRTSEGLRMIEYASVAMILLAYAAGSINRPLDGSGFVVARDSGLMMTACSWASSKWAHLAGGDAVFRVSAGRWGEPQALELDDDALVARIHDEINRTVGVDTPPKEARVVRWPLSFPQQTVGHLQRVGALEESLNAEAPGVLIAGAAYRGLGLPACIGQAEAAVSRLLR